MNTTRQCQCYCHGSMVNQSYGHDSVCCSDMNGIVINKPENKLKSQIGLLRQWLNEERITDPKKMVTNEDIASFLKE